MIEDPNKYKFLRDWKKFMSDNISRMYPDLDEEEIDEELNQMIKENCINPECEIHNNYQHRKVKLNLLEVKYIIAFFICPFSSISSKKSTIWSSNT